mmetsp:Transcript_5333/g.10168  ORF Transcript_5333/g.10168 Transcript_5333/m.10168 type:complete len:323 (-) Transcript_5333:20-988(-)
MEEIQAAIERMNALDYVDEAELEKLEAEIEARLLALEEDNARRAAESEDEEEASPSSHRIPEAANHPPPQTHTSTSDKVEGGWELLEGVSQFGQYIKTKTTQQFTPEPIQGLASQSATKKERTEPKAKPPPPPAPRPQPLTGEQKKTLQLLDTWARSEGARKGGASKLFGYSGVRADLAQSYGRLLLKPKGRRASTVSAKVQETMSDLESAFPPPVATKREEEAVGYERASREMDALLSRIEEQVRNSTTTVAQHVGGGVAAPGVAAIGEFYARQSKTVQRGLLVVFMILLISCYLVFYEEEEVVEEGIVEHLEEGGAVFKP